METIKQIIEVVGAVEVVVVLIGLVWAVMLWFKGITPALYRLGNGLARRKIAIFAKGDNMVSLKKLLLDSKLFSSSNIIEITSDRDIGVAEQASVYLVHWHDWAPNVTQILNQKKDSYPLIVYAPHDLGSISKEDMKSLGDCRNTAVSNFRGRLLNDIVTAMITTAYQK